MFKNLEEREKMLSKDMENIKKDPNITLRHENYNLSRGEKKQYLKICCMELMTDKEF